MHWHRICRAAMSSIPTSLVCVSTICLLSLLACPKPLPEALVASPDPDRVAAQKKEPSAKDPTVATETISAEPNDLAVRFAEPPREFSSLVDLGTKGSVISEDAAAILEREGIRVATGERDTETTRKADASRTNWIRALVPPHPGRRSDLLALKRWTDASLTLGVAPIRVAVDDPPYAILTDAMIQPNLHIWADYARRAALLGTTGRAVPDLFIVVAGDPDRAVTIVQRLVAERLEFRILNESESDALEIGGGRVAMGEMSAPAILALGWAGASEQARSALDRAREAGVKVFRMDTFGASVEPSGDVGGDSRVVPIPSARMPGADSRESTPTNAVLQSLLETIQPVIVFQEQDLTFRGVGNLEPANRVREFKIDPGAFPLRQHHRIVDGTHFFWLSNPTDQIQHPRVLVRGMDRGASIWNCETGATRPAAARLVRDGAHLQLSFQPYEAYYLVFDGTEGGAAAAPRETVRQWTLAMIDGPWQVRIDPATQAAGSHSEGTGDSRAPEDLLGDGRALETLAPWSELGLQAFAGLVVYHTAFELPTVGEETVWLDLGRVEAIASIAINGHPAAVRVWPPYWVDVTPHVKRGANSLELRFICLPGAGHGAGITGPVQLMGKTPEP